MLCRPLTLHEANALLPLVQDRMEELHLYWEQGQSIRKDMLRRISSDSMNQARTHGIPSAALQEELGEIEALITERVLDLQRYGAFVREVFPGVVEFYATRAGTPVLLNWHFGEEKIGQWLALGEDPSEAAEIQDKHLFGPAVEH